MPVSPARRAAFEILRRVEEESAYSSVLLAAGDPDLNSKDRALCHELVLGTLRRRLWLDRTIEHFGQRRTEKLDPPVVQALRLGLYQLRFLTRIPPSAAVNESVNLVRAAKLKSAASFVNAVLRRATREPEYDPVSTVDDPIDQLVIETSHPRWLIERWTASFGFESAAAVARADNQPAPLAFRFTAKANTEGQISGLIDKLSAAGIRLQESEIVRGAWRVRSNDLDENTDHIAYEKGARLELLHRLTTDGLIYFQDVASQLVAQLLEEQGGERLLDVCAAPGSKSTLISALAPTATIIAGDLYEHRARTIKGIAAQQQARNIHPIVYDATCELPFTNRTFDGVLVDAPCSGTGTLRHNPEIRWRLQAPDITELAAKQTGILRNAALMVRPGGVLIYSTCSLEIEENEQVASQFREKNPDFDVSQLNITRALLTPDASVRTWPHRDDTDGFFVAAFQRRI